MRKKPKFELILHTGHSQSFLGLYKDNKIAIKGLKTRYSIFVVEARNYNLVLGQLFHNITKFNQDYKPNVIFSFIIHFQAQ